MILNAIKPIYYLSIPIKRLRMALDLSIATPLEIEAELSKYSLNRKRLAYEVAIEDVLSIGQENWDGDKKHY